MRVATIVAAVLLAAGAGPGWQAPAPEPITVSAAVSLTDVLQEVAAAYAQNGGGTVRFNFGASNTLARQVVEGAPVDLFISADEAQMDVVAKAGLLDAASRADLLANRLAVVVSPEHRRAFTSLRDLLDPAFKRIAIGDPAAVPAGVYAKQYLERAGIWEQVQSRLVPSASVRAALAAVDAGSADAAVVYRTDTHAAKRAVVAWVAPIWEGPRIIYPAAIVKGRPAAAQARRFLDFLRTATATRIFEKYDFIPVESRPR
ncbi:MAG: molybdate ABC transporter substrate-binding protein [Acidobacteria bacterium]|nr:MAG: molybdate ABC transporter substrate-binding protein [Acidobacteriota bacterium]